MEAVSFKNNDTGGGYCEQYAGRSLELKVCRLRDKIPLTEQDKEQMFVDILPDIPDDDGTAYLTFYLDEEEDVAPVLMNVRKELEDMRAFLMLGCCTSRN